MLMVMLPLIYIGECTFDNNRAESESGVSWTTALGRAFYISDSLFVKNQAGKDGGVLVMDTYFDKEGQLIITGSTFDQNKAGMCGDVFSTLAPCISLVNNSSFTSNQAGTDGGMIYVGGGSSQVRISDGSMFGYNNTTGRGGVISINESRLEISNTTVFSDNIAAIGDDIIACDCDIKSNTAFIQHSYTDPSFQNCTIYGHYQVTIDSPVAMAISIPVGFVVILILLMAIIVLACLCFR